MAYGIRQNSARLKKEVPAVAQAAGFYVLWYSSFPVLVGLFTGEEGPYNGDHNNGYDQADKNQSAAGFYVIKKTVMAGS